MLLRRIPQAILVLVVVGGVAAQAHANEVPLTNGTAKPVTSGTAKPIVTAQPKPLVTATPLAPTSQYQINRPIIDPETVKQVNLEHEQAKKLVEQKDKVCYTPQLLESKAWEFQKNQPVLRQGPAPTPIADPNAVLSKGAVAGSIVTAGASGNLSLAAGAQIQYTGVTDQNGDHHMVNASVRIYDKEYGPQYESGKGLSWVRDSTMPVGANLNAGVTGGLIFRNPGSTASGNDIANSQYMSGGIGLVNGSFGNTGSTVTAGPAIGLNFGGKK